MWRAWARSRACGWAMAARCCRASGAGRTGAFRSPPRPCEPRAPAVVSGLFFPYGANAHLESGARRTDGIRLDMMGSMTFRVVLITLLALPVGGCSGGLNFWPFGGSSDSSDTADIPEDPASVPVEVLYNRGVDSMNAKKYTEASTQF